MNFCDPGLPRARDGASKKCRTAFRILETMGSARNLRSVLRHYKRQGTTPRPNRSHVAVFRLGMLQVNGKVRVRRGGADGGGGPGGKSSNGGGGGGVRGREAGGRSCRFALGRARTFLRWRLLLR